MIMIISSDINNVLLKDIDLEIQFILLCVPFLLMSIAFFRYVIGFKLFNLGQILILITFITFLTNELSLLTHLITATILVILNFFLVFYIRKIFFQATMHYLVKLSMVLIVASLLGLSFFALVSLNIDILKDFEYTKINSISILIFLLLSEYFSNIQTQKGFKVSREMLWGSLFVCIVLSYFILSPFFQKFILEYPYFFFIFAGVTFFIGKYKGLRLKEVIRFRSIDLNKDE